MWRQLTFTCGHVLVFLASAFAYGASDSIPEAWKTTVEFDQNFNVEGRASVAKSSQNGVRRIFAFDVPINELEFVRSKYMSSSIQQMLIRKNNGEDYIRVFDLNATIPVAGAIDGPVYYGTKMLSHKTYLVWSDRPGEQPFYAKLTDTSDIATAKSALQSVYMNDVVLTDLPVDGTAPHFLPETFAVSSRNTSKPFYNIIREALPYGRTLGATEVLMPLHGLIGGIANTDYWKIAGYEDEVVWFRDEVIKNLAAQHAILHYRFGIWPEAHTQNTLLIIDKGTGKVHSVVFRDMFDVALDPIVRYLWGLDPLPNSVRELSTIHRSHVDQDIAQDSASPGSIMSAYHWGFNDLVLRNYSWLSKLTRNMLGVKQDRYDFRLFYEHQYRNAAAALAGYDENSLVPSVSLQNPEQTDHFYQFMTAIPLRQLGIHASSVPSSKALLQFFAKRMREGSVVFASQNYRDRLRSFQSLIEKNPSITMTKYEFSFDGGHILILYDRAVAGLILGIQNWEAKQLQLPEVSNVCRTLGYRAR